VNHALGHLALVFGGLSLLAIGGGSSLLPEMQRVCVENGWTDAQGFSETYSLGQVAPGPPMTMVVLLGYHVAGVAGAIVVLLAFFTPACCLTWAVSRAWSRFEGSPWHEAVENGLAPVSIGLLLSGALAIGQSAINDAFSLAITVVALLLALWKDPSPALLVLGAGLVAFCRTLLP
jgi:chromate transporter